MAKFVIECPNCGKYAEARTGFFARKKIDCACGYYKGNSCGTAGWWLRSPGYSFRLAADVNCDGSVSGSGYRVIAEIGAVRPALWIDISNR